MGQTGLLKTNNVQKLANPDNSGFQASARPQAADDDAQSVGLTQEQRDKIESLPSSLIRTAWFTMAHLVLEPGATIGKMGCRDGALLFIMAAMNPQHHFIGLSRDPKIMKAAAKNYMLPNLEYRLMDPKGPPAVEPGSLDAIVNSFVLHEIYSTNRCNDQVVTTALRDQFTLLKQDGILFIEDFAMPNDSFVTIEIPDEQKIDIGDKKVSAPDLLVEYSEKARPFDNPAHRGFYLEELPARFPRTRLFRLPSKWAHEFILRKDDIENWESELGKEYTFFTERDYRRALRDMGARVLYTAPHWDEQIIKSRFDKKFKLFDEAGAPLGSPPTSFIAVAQKMGVGKSLVLQERKPLRNQPTGRLQITAMRDDVEGRIYDIINRGVELSEVMPYRITSDGRLHVFVHEGLPRGIVNAVPRNGPNLDGKQWSGHMTETLAIPQEKIQDVKPNDFKSLVRFAQGNLGLKPVNGATLEHGPGFYPAPDSIDERIETHYINVEKPTGSVILPGVCEEIDGFSTRGRLREIEGQTILNAVGVGLIPSGRMEIQILALYEKLGLPYQAWADCPLILKEEEPEEVTKLEKIISNLAATDHRYKEVRGTAGQLRTVHSVFVDEGQVDGGIEGLASRNMEFAVTEDKSMNIAVILPLTRKINGEVMAGIVEQFLPVPQRYKGNGYIVSCPSLPLPKDITNLEMAKKYIAEKFEVPVDCVARMGESFFSHISVTPQRIYPFAVSTAGATGWRKVGRTHGTTRLTPLVDLHKLLYLDNYYSFMKVVGLAHASTIGKDSDMSAKSTFSRFFAADKSQPIALRGTTVESAPSGGKSTLTDYPEPSGR
jgi:hypothetical protein